jgi:hypothetical protein
MYVPAGDSFHDVEFYLVKTIAPRDSSSAKLAISKM